MAYADCPRWRLLPLHLHSTCCHALVLPHETFERGAPNAALQRRLLQATSGTYGERPPHARDCASSAMDRQHEDHSMDHSMRAAQQRRKRRHCAGLYVGRARTIDVIASREVERRGGRDAGGGHGHTSGLLYNNRRLRHRRCLRRCLRRLLVGQLVLVLLVKLPLLLLQEVGR